MKQGIQGPDPRQPPQQGPGPQVQFQPVPPAILELLEEWEKQTQGISSLYCPITRFEFDNVFATETRSVGKVYFQNPDQGRIDFFPADEALLKKGAGRQDDQGNPFKVIAGAETKWICTGQKIYILEMKEKQYNSILIPPQNQGQNITLSPLPFIFGMKASDATKRFAFRFGGFHNPNGNKLGANGKPMRKAIHIVAFPLHAQEAQEYREADVILDPTTFLPMNLRTLDPAGNKETVYSFDQSAMKVNVKWGLTNPFREPLLPGWTEMHRGNAEPEQAQRGSSLK